MQALIALLVLAAPAQAAHAPLTPDRLREAQISVRAITGGTAGAIYSVKWSDDGKSCSAAQSSRATDEPHWKSIPADGCEKLRQLLLASSAELATAADEAEKSKRPVPFQKTMGQLVIADYKLAVNLNTAARCDVDMQNCVEPKLSTASRVALLVRTVTTGAFGRLSRPRGE